ncbi:MAG: cation:dicarboxylase symporter family transporter, partial [Bryobacteraceae bacterium]
MKFHRSLYFRVILGIVLGVLLGVLYPNTAASMKPLGDGFIKLIRMMIAPIVFFTVVVGIASIGDMKKLGRVGLKSLLYFEVLTTVALLIGLTVVKIVQPGAGMNVNPATLDASAVAQYAAQGRELHAVDFLLNIIPATVTSAFTQGDILQVLLVAILFGLALAAIPRNRAIIDACDKIAHWLFAVVAIIMQA